MEQENKPNEKSLIQIHNNGFEKIDNEINLINKLITNTKGYSTKRSI